MPKGFRLTFSAVLLGFFAAILPLPSMATAERMVEGRAAVLDGDTLDVGGQTIRLLHIDAPETGQPFGAAATRALLRVTEGRRVVCRGRATDADGRLLAECAAGPRDLGAALVWQGAAVVFRRYGDTHAGLEAEAKRAGRGLWAAAAPQMPWDYRAQRWTAAADAPARADCPIKGNISRSDERIYHAAWSRWYDRTRIDTARGERWFCNEAEALAAGWRAPRG